MTPVSWKAHTGRLVVNEIQRLGCNIFEYCDHRTLANLKRVNILIASLFSCRGVSCSETLRLRLSVSFPALLKKEPIHNLFSSILTNPGRSLQVHFQHDSSTMVVMSPASAKSNRLLSTYSGGATREFGECSFTLPHDSRVYSWDMKGKVLVRFHPGFMSMITNGKTELMLDLEDPRPEKHYGYLAKSIYAFFVGSHLFTVSTEGVVACWKLNSERITFVYSSRLFDDNSIDKAQTKVIVAVQLIGQTLFVEGAIRSKKVAASSKLVWFVSCEPALPFVRMTRGLKDVVRQQCRYTSNKVLLFASYVLENSVHVRGYALQLNAFRSVLKQEIVIKENASLMRLTADDENLVVAAQRNDKVHLVTYQLQTKPIKKIQKLFPLQASKSTYVTLQICDAFLMYAQGNHVHIFTKFSLAHLHSVSFEHVLAVASMHFSEDQGIRFTAHERLSNDQTSLVVYQYPNKAPPTESPQSSPVAESLSPGDGSYRAAKRRRTTRGRNDHLLPQEEKKSKPPLKAGSAQKNVRFATVAKNSFPKRSAQPKAPSGKPAVEKKR
ncbi:MAG: hypothetical protein H0X51_06225 [Parachlamydiaceae bacterium]|nr:hypothetical protein [Parachlamydiaceae bacterium]